LPVLDLLAYRHASPIFPSAPPTTILVHPERPTGHPERPRGHPQRPRGHPQRPTGQPQRSRGQIARWPDGQIARSPDGQMARAPDPQITTWLSRPRGSQASAGQRPSPEAQRPNPWASTLLEELPSWPHQQKPSPPQELLGSLPPTHLITADAPPHSS